MSDRANCVQCGQPHQPRQTQDGGHTWRHTDGHAYQPAGTTQPDVPPIGYTPTFFGAHVTCDTCADARLIENTTTALACHTHWHHRQEQP
jgi:hypothetical protein